MKNKILIGLMPLYVSLVMACNGDHSSKSGADTAQNHYNAPSNIDTSKPVTTAGDASVIDNSASGGTRVAKPDTVKTDTAHK